MCSFCEGPARVVPGPIYRDADWLAFADIDMAIFDAELDGAAAATLAEKLQQLLTLHASTETVATQMIECLPPLVKCRPALANGVPRGLRMLMTLLTARARDAPLNAPAPHGPG